MKIKHLLLATLVSVTSLLNAQVNEFTWVNGNTSINQAPVYGTQGVPSVTNSPGARESAMTWTDGSGNFWLFGGIDQTSAYKGDLWRYNPSTNEWTWVHGSNSSGAGAPQISTTAQGVPSNSNTPGCRYGSCTWTSLDGNTLYLFGGWGMTGMGSQGLYNNLWSYDIANNTWTYLKGALGMTQSAMYTGASSSLTPGSKQGAVGWKGPDGMLYLFGGNGYASGASSGLTNDLWKYDPTTNNWFFINGNTTINPISGTSPGGMTEAVAFYDGLSNKAYVTGGLGRTWNSTAGRLNDMWSFNMTTNIWSYESGNSGNVDDGGIYGTIGIEQAGVFPRARDRAKGVVLKSGKFAYFGGYGWNGSSLDQFGDYWEYNPYTKQWAWMRGNIPTTTNQNGVYGTVGISSSTNIPGERFATSVWKDYQGNLWLFGGTGLGITGSTVGRLSDLWKFTPDCTPPTLSPVNTTTASSFCLSNAALTSTANAIIAWYATNTSTTALGYGESFYPTNLSAGAYTYYTESTNGCGISPTRTPVSFSINPSPTITVNSGTRCLPGAFTITPSGATSYTVQGGNFVVTPISFTTYTLIGSTSGCLSNIITCSVNVGTKPNISVNSGTICSGDSFTINPNGAVSYTIENGNSVVTPTTNSSYTVVGMSALGCLSSNTATSNITVNSIPTLSINSSANENICMGQSAILTAVNNGATSYNWNNGAITNSITVTPTINTIYSVIITAATSCTTSAAITLTVNTCTSIFEGTIDGLISLYPNPTNEFVHINILNNAIENIELIDLSGKIIYTANTINAEQLIDLTNVKAGIYVIKASADNNCYYKKLVKL